MAQNAPPPSIVVVLSRQLNVSLEMLRRAMEQCPPAAWTTDEPVLAVWQHGYNALLGLSIWLTWPTPVIAFPPFHRDGADSVVGAEPPCSREQMEAFGVEVADKARAYLARLTPENVMEQLVLRGKVFTRADIVLGQLRHVQHHVGCMHTQLRRRTGTAPGWLGYGESE